uniref:Disks large-associated protein 4 n=1 Tax=Parascaris univalens TaxID=6257 RepID=A0A914ZV95_PARUN
MPSAQVTTTSGNVCEREGRPSALGHFLSKFGSAKTRSKSPTITLSLKYKANTSLPKDSTHTDLAKEDFHKAEGMPHCGVRFSQKTTLINNESNITDVDLSRTPPPKPKRTSSPFARVLNRLSMSRKHFNSASNEHIHEISPETAPLTISASPSCIATSPRPAISENDLRHITLQRGQVPASEITPLSGAIPFRSEDNLVGSTMRTPSYLRVSCALNGYRQYRRLELNGTPLRTPTGALPMSNVQRRALLFNSPQIHSSGASSLSPQTQSNGGVKSVIETPTPVRQLVARFDELHVSSAEKSFPEKENLLLNSSDNME